MGVWRITRAAAPTVAALILIDHKGPAEPSILFNIFFAGVLGMMVMGAEAANNTDTTAINNSPVAVSTVSAASSADASSATINQLQNLITQYQNREQQYQTEISKLSRQPTSSEKQSLFHKKSFRNRQNKYNPFQYSQIETGQQVTNVM